MSLLTGLNARRDKSTGQAFYLWVWYMTPYSMFERFSRGYYLGRLYVEPRASEHAAMCRDQHEQVNEQLYASDEGVERLDRPLVMKLETNHFPVAGEEAVPRDTLVVPRSLLEDTNIRNPPALKEVLLAKADRARQLLDITGATVDDPPPSDQSRFDRGSGGPAF